MFRYVCMYACMHVCGVRRTRVALQWRQAGAAASSEINTVTQAILRKTAVGLGLKVLCSN